MAIHYSIKPCRFCGTAFYGAPKSLHCSMACSCLSRVNITASDRCWLWVPVRGAGGYGGGYGELVYSGLAYKAHRVMWWIVNGPIPADRPDFCVLHHCDNPTCCNPGHLYLGTQKDNAGDRERRGRHISAKGERHGRAKLTEQQVLEIRATTGVSQEKLAAMHGVGQSRISDIKLRKHWRHIP